MWQAPSSHSTLATHSCRLANLSVVKYNTHHTRTAGLGFRNALKFILDPKRFCSVPLDMLFCSTKARNEIYSVQMHALSAIHIHIHSLQCPIVRSAVAVLKSKSCQDLVRLLPALVYVSLQPNCSSMTAFLRLLGRAILRSDESRFCGSSSFSR